LAKGKQINALAAACERGEINANKMACPSQAILSLGR
jgi:hypothetical protein